jgi:uncharacterized SAM-binding protein YcdF (DUF218 family)
MFLLRKIIAPLLFPLPLCLALLLVGLVLLWCPRRQRAGRVLVTLGTLLLTLLSYNAVAVRLLRPVESRYAPLPAVEATAAPVRWVAVLGGGTSSDARLAPRARLSEASLARLVEGVRLQRQLPGSRLILSGGRVFGYGSDAEAMAALARELGVRDEEIVSEPVSLDTEAQAHNIRGLVGDDAFILVTSAAHMPRAVALFTKVGLHPVPAPTHFLAQQDQSVNPADFYPGAGGLRKSETAFYEYLGTMWAKLKGSI